ncbi:hypothetical protein SDC9_184324 [bioreactor metagenome]|uniref:Uncharacterized protein n=1 Tax=bioreactor metagenome TaxID=1076179 RepID=A0A645HMY6_9ZZZZ
MTIIHLGKRVMVDVIFQFSILDLQLFFRFLQFFGKTLDLQVRPQNISVLIENEHSQNRTQYYQQHRGC